MCVISTHLFLLKEVKGLLKPMTSFYWDLRLANGRSWLGNQIIKSGNQNIDWGVSESQGNFKLFVYKHIDKCIKTKSMGQRGSKGKSLLLSLSLGESLNHVCICIHGIFFQTSF